MPSRPLKENTLTAAGLRLTKNSSSKHESSLAARATSRTVPPLGALAVTDAEYAWQDCENYLPSSLLQLQLQKPTTSDVNGLPIIAPAGGTGNCSRTQCSFGSLSSPSVASLATRKTACTAEGHNLKPAGHEAENTSMVLASNEASNQAIASEVPARLYSYKDYEPNARIVYTRDEEEANDVADTLKGPLGFDMEWRVIMRRGVPPTERRTATIQLADQNTILIVQVSAMDSIPQKIKALIENASIPKIGANIVHDGQKLLRDFGVMATNLVELGALAREADPSFLSKRSIVSLSRMIEEYCDGRILDKGPVRMSNWETNPLTEDQRTYAANDAHSALMAYRRILRIATIHDRTLDPTKFTSIVSRKQQLNPSLSADVVTMPAGVTNTSSEHNPVPATAQTPSSKPLRPQYLNAYNLWHHRNLSLDEMCSELRSRGNLDLPLARSTVISYVVNALKAQPSLPFSVTRLKALARQDGGSWIRYRDWLQRQDTETTSSY